jgi:hypothetical protein
VTHDEALEQVEKLHKAFINGEMSGPQYLSLLKETLEKYSAPPQ